MLCACDACQAARLATAAKRWSPATRCHRRRRRRGQRRREVAPRHSAALRLQDNGTGMPHNDIPDMLGRVLSGTKYGVGQTRGKFGLGAKMALLWSKMTTGMPFLIESAQAGQEFVSHYELDIDVLRNEPNVHAVEARSCSPLPPIAFRIVRRTSVCWGR
jgi:DNA topoisomerase VI subunit B